MEWNRRDVLRALGASAAVPAALTLSSGGCSGTARTTRTVRQSPARTTADLRSQLRDIIDRLRARHADPLATVTVRRLGVAHVDAKERAVDVQETDVLTLSVNTRGGRLHHAVDDLTPAGVNAAATALDLRAGSKSTAGPLPASRRDPDPDTTTAMALDPRHTVLPEWLNRVTNLHSRARAFGGSRMIYRRAFLTVDDAEHLVVGELIDRAQRIVRTRAGVVFVAWTGTRAVTAQATRAGTGGLENLELGDATLAASADRALSLIAARTASSGVTDVIYLRTSRGFSLTVASHHPLPETWWATGEAILARKRGAAIASSLITVSDDPTAPELYGSYRFDDEGWLGKPTTLIDSGVVTDPLTCHASARALGLPRTGHARRPGIGKPAQPQASNLSVSPGEQSLSELIGDVKQGLLIDQGTFARTDLSTQRMVLRGGQAQEVQNGRITGRLFGTVDVVTDLPGLLGSVRGVSSTHERMAATSPSPMSIGAPHVLTRAWVSGA